VLESARASAAVRDDRWWLPELYRINAQRHRGAAAQDLLRQAITLAEEQGSEALVRRAVADLERQHAARTDGERLPNAPRHTIPGRCRADQAAGRVGRGL